MEKTEDLRVRRTYKLLSEALMTIMKKEPFEKITVKDICDTAMVHRTTFYTHFEDKYALLRYCMKDLEAPFDSVEITENSYEGYREYYTKVAKTVLEHVYNNHDFFRLLIKKNHDDSFLSNMQETLTEKIENKLRMVAENGVQPKVPIEMLSAIYSAACLNAIFWWVENDMPFSTDELIEYFALIIHSVL